MSSEKTRANPMAAPGGGEIDPYVAQTIKEGKRRRSSGRDPKEEWKQTNIRMDPELKVQLKQVARGLGVPLEEIIHVSMIRFLEELKAGEIKLETRGRRDRQTLL